MKHMIKQYGNEGIISKQIVSLNISYLEELKTVQIKCTQNFVFVNLLVNR